jgi:hypothetical protein
MANSRLLTIKAWFHEGGLRFERWLNPVSGLFEAQQPEMGFTHEQARRERSLLQHQLHPSTKLFLVALGSPLPAQQLALARPNGRRSPHT